MALANPVMPLITDSIENLSDVARGAANAGAVYMMGGVLFLQPCAQKAFFPFLEQHYPHLVKKYQERYGSGAFIRGPYAELIAKRISEIRRQFGLTQKPDRYEPDLWAGDPQLSLFTLPSLPSSVKLPPHSMPEKYNPAAHKAPRRQKLR